MTLNAAVNLCAFHLLCRLTRGGEHRSFTGPAQSRASSPAFAWVPAAGIMKHKEAPAAPGSPIKESVNANKRQENTRLTAFDVRRQSVQPHQGPDTSTGTVSLIAVSRSLPPSSTGMMGCAAAGRFPQNTTAVTRVVLGNEFTCSVAPEGDFLN